MTSIHEKVEGCYICPASRDNIGDIFLLKINYLLSGENNFHYYLRIKEIWGLK